MPGRHQLTELQLAILRVLWDRGEATVQDIWEALHAERGLAQTTVATMLSRLARRAVVPRRAQSRQSRLELSTPASVALPVASLPQAALLNQPAAPASDAGNPGVRRAVRDAAGASVSRAPSLPLVVVLVWGAIALGWCLHYVARRLI